MLPLLIGFGVANAAPNPHTSPTEYTIQPPVEDVWAGNARFVQDKKLFGPNAKRKVFMTDDPDFALAHQLSSIGLTTIVVGTGVTAGALAWSAIMGIMTILDDDKTPVTNSLKFAGYSALSVVGGAGVSYIGSSIARNVLVSKGQQVPFFGGYIATFGVVSVLTGFGTILHWNGVEPSDERQQIGQMMSLTGLAVIPIGLVTQHITNRVAYNQYFDSVSLAPTFSTESVGGMVQVQF
jgi:hypothetical protein